MDAEQEILIKHRLDVDLERVRAHYQSAHDRRNMVNSFALFLLRTMALLSGGAVIALASVLGNARSLHLTLPPLYDSFGWFAASLVATLVAGFLAFFGQQFLQFAEMGVAEAIYRSSVTGQYQLTPKEAAYVVVGNVVIILASATYLVAVMAFIGGARTAMLSAVVA